MREPKEVKRIMKGKSGITLIALVITIIVLLILAGVSIMMLTGDNSILRQAVNSKEKTEEAGRIENINEAYFAAMIDTNGDEITVESMQNALDNVFGTNMAEAIDNIDTLVVRIGKKYYEINNKGNIENGRTLETIEYGGDITKNGKCTGTATNPYRIECIEDLVALSKNTNTGTTYNGKYIILTKDLDFNSIFSYANYKSKYKFDSEKNAYIPDETSETTLRELCTTEQGFIPIGNTTTNVGFMGNFNGCFNNVNHEIKNIYIKRADRAALFGACGGEFTPWPQSIKNLTISGTITCTGSEFAAGFVSGILTYGFKNIENCTNKAKIINTGSGYAVGISPGGDNVIGCENYGEVISQNASAFGIVRPGVDSNVKNCINYGNITAKNGASGVIGNNINGAYRKAFINCVNYGVVKSLTGTAAGVKNDSRCTCKNCGNYGEVISGIGNGTYGAGSISAGGWTTDRLFAVNCCSTGTLSILNGTESQSVGVTVKGAGNNNYNKNCYYLEGIQGKFALSTFAGDNVFYKSSENEEDIITTEVVEALNSYIESNEDDVDTTDWCKWVVGNNNLPELDFNTKWDGTAWVRSD